MDHIVREISQTFLVRDLRDHRGKSAKLGFFLNQESGTSDFCCGTGCFKTCSSATDHNNVTRLVYFLLHVVFPGVDSRVYGTADWLV